MEYISENSDNIELGIGKKILVIDMGGSAIKAGLFKNGKLIKEMSWRHNYKDCGIESAKSDLVANLRKICDCKVDIVALGIAGLISKDGTLFRSTVLTSFTGFDLGKFLAKEFRASDHIQDNDADCGAIGEHYYSKKELLYVVVGSGIGSACVDCNGELLYKIRIDRDIPFAEDMNHSISDMGLRLSVSPSAITGMFMKIGIKDHGLQHGISDVQLGDLGSAIGVSNILKILWKGKFSGKYCKDHYRKFLCAETDMMKDLFDERYAAKVIAHLAKNGDLKSILAYRLMGRFLGKAILEAEKILYLDHGRYFPVYLAGNVLDSRELFWNDMIDEIAQSGVEVDCMLSESYLAGVNPNMLGAYLRARRKVTKYG